MEKRVVEIWRRGPFGLVCFALGAAATTAVLGSPKLWSQEAAGWASAIGTVFAALVALWLAMAESRRRAEEQEGRARWLREELRIPISDWQNRCARVEQLLSQGADAVLYDILNLEPKHLYPFSIPAQITELTTRLHDLGKEGKPLVRAVSLARRLDRSGMVLALRGDLDLAEETEVRASFRKNLNSLREALEAVFRGIGEE